MIRFTFDEYHVWARREVDQLRTLARATLPEMVTLGVVRAVKSADRATYEADARTLRELEDAVMVIEAMRNNQ